MPLKLISYVPRVIILFFGLHWSEVIFAQNEAYQVIDPTDLARIYNNPEERREAGLGTHLTKWLKFSGLIETESVFLDHHFKKRKNTSKIETPSVTLQLGFDIIFTDWLSAELIIEAEHDGQRFNIELDEGFFNAEIAQWGIKVGRQYLNFGEYYSHFITGPMLEFGETRGTALIIDYSFIELFEISAYIFESEVGHKNSHSDIDWGVNFDFTSTDESIGFGIGFLSDLSESDEKFISGASYYHRVSAWNAYALISLLNFEITAEVVQALRAFKELEKQNNKPFSFNLELAYFSSATTQFALRLEHSNEFSDQPMWQYGIASTWRPTQTTNISVEYLYAKFHNNFAFDDNDNELKNRHTIALQLSFEF